MASFKTPSDSFEKKNNKSKQSYGPCLPDGSSFVGKAEETDRGRHRPRFIFNDLPTSQNPSHFSLCVRKAEVLPTFSIYQNSPWFGPWDLIVLVNTTLARNHKTK